MKANEYAFLTLWKVKASAEEVYEILNDVEGYVRWWPGVYRAVERVTPAGSDGLGETYRLLTRGKLPYWLRWNATVIERRRPHGFPSRLRAISSAAMSGRSMSVQTISISCSIGGFALRSLC
jgi:hypothetical protein